MGFCHPTHEQHRLLAIKKRCFQIFHQNKIITPSLRLTFIHYTKKTEHLFLHDIDCNEEKAFHHAL